MEIFLSPSNSTSHAGLPPKDPSPSLSKVWQDDATGDFVIADSDGLHLGVRWRLDNKGYDVSSSKGRPAIQMVFADVFPVGPHRVRPGQQVVVTDPKMSSFLPIPSSSMTISLEPVEVILRFSAGEQVFLHAVGATATFGRGLTRPGDGWRIGGGPVRLLNPGKGDEQACQALRPLNHGRPFVLVVQRGGCTFLTKLVHATQADAAGVVVIGTPPDPSGSMDSDGGLIRPSADGEPEIVHRFIENSGMVYVDSVIGEVVGRIMARAGVEVEVEVMRLGESEGEGEMVYDAGTGERIEGDGDREGQMRDRDRDKPREGRLALGQWEIWNLRITERPP